MEMFDGGIRIRRSQKLDENRVVISLSADSGEAALGAHDIAGEIRVNNKDGEKQIWLNGADGAIDLTGTLTSDGKIAVRDAMGREVVVLSATGDGYLTVFGKGNLLELEVTNGVTSNTLHAMSGAYVGDTIAMEASGLITAGGVRADALAVNPKGVLTIPKSATLRLDGDITFANEITHLNVGTLMARQDIFIGNADIAEEFDVSEDVEVVPGHVVVLDESQMSIRPAMRPYDRRVTGIISGAGQYRQGIVLDAVRAGAGVSSAARRVPVAMIGKVMCWVDADLGEVRVGDMLTTSATPGHAMRVGTAASAAGSIIGKAMRPLHQGRGLVPVLVSLQ